MGAPSDDLRDPPPHRHHPHPHHRQHPHHPGHLHRHHLHEHPPRQLRRLPPPPPPHHPLATATHTDGSPLHLVFHTSDRIRNHQHAASAAFDVGNRQTADDTGQTWPDDIRSVSVGDVIKITGPGHWIIHLSVDSFGFTPVPEPTHLTGLAGKTRVTSRR
ncbi:hypothetical protein [Streptomyces griseus]|uniref:hypothetical protein n=1 Tax=Streptomyces griseus TaxID=1911 RepID=UPI00380DD44E